MTKFKHAPDFGVTQPNNSAGRQAFADSMRDFINDDATTSVRGSYREAGSNNAIFNYNSSTRQVVVQHADGSFWTSFIVHQSQLKTIQEDKYLR